MKKSKFNLDNDFKTSFEFGQLVPFMYRDVVAGDVMRGNSNAFVRMLPLIFPVMHKMDIFTRYYFVPYRLLVDKFEKIQTKPESDLRIPNLYDAGLKGQSLHKILLKDNLLRQFGITSSDGSLTEESAKLISQLPFRAYHLIYNHFYLDPILNADEYIDDFEPSEFDRWDFEKLLKIRQGTYYNDYFTSTLPTTQYGTEVVLDMDGDGQIKVNEMRIASMLQSLKESILLYGQKYGTFLKHHFGIAPNNSTLDKPLYLGGSKQPLNIFDVDATNQSENVVLGNSAGKSVSSTAAGNFKLEAQEHGILLGLCYIQPRQSYVQGIPREFIKSDYYSFYLPMYANLGMQETYGAELDASRTDTFGYNERFAELKYAKDVVAGDFVDQRFMHLGRNLHNAKLNKNFKMVPKESSIFAVDSYLKRDRVYSADRVGIAIFTETDVTQLSSVPSYIDGYAVFYIAAGYSIAPGEVSVAEYLKYKGIWKDDVVGSVSDPKEHVAILPVKSSSNSIRHSFSEADYINSNKLAETDAISGVYNFAYPTNDENIINAVDFVYSYDAESDSFKETNHSGIIFSEPYKVKLKLSTGEGGKMYLSNYYLGSAKSDFGDDLTFLVADDEKDFHMPSDLVGANHVYAIFYNNCDALRPIPKVYKPGLM